MDERFFMYGEDMDWCKRFSQAGLEKKYYPEAEAIHFGGGSSMNKPKRFFVEMLRANIQYWKKHHGKLQTRVSFLLYILHNILRVLLNSVLWILKTDQRSNYQFKIERSLGPIVFC
jgi:GT2 family glycosyltransferase